MLGLTDSIQLTFPHSDKVLHFLAFSGTSFGVHFISKEIPVNIEKKFVRMIIFGCGCVGSFWSEFAQSRLTRRVYDLNDVYVCV